MAFDPSFAQSFTVEDYIQESIMIARVAEDTSANLIDSFTVIS
jgi:hypothetical protein